MADRLVDDHTHVHGTSRHATHAELQAAGYGLGGRLSCGYARATFESSRPQEFSYSGVKPINLVAYNRSHKGTTLIRFLCDHTGSAVVVDPRGETVEATLRYRRDVLGQNIILVDPFDQVASSLGLDADAVHVLGFVDPSSLAFFEQCGVVADGLIVPAPGGKDAFWDNSSLDALTTSVAEATMRLLGQASLYDATALFSKSRIDLFQALDGVLEKDANGAYTGRKITPGMVDADDSIIQEGASRLSATDDKTLFNIFSTVRSNTGFLASRALRKALSPDGKCLTQLLDGNTTLYIVVPPQHASYHARLSRLLISVAMHITSGAKPALDPPLLVLWDECALSGTSKALIDNFGVLAGSGVQVVSVWQDLLQLQRLYPKIWESMIANAGVNICLGASDLSTARYFANLSGTADIRMTGNESATRQTDPFRRKEFQSVQDDIKSRPLIPMERIRSMRPWEALFFGTGVNVAMGYKAPYYLDAKYRDRQGRPLFDIPERYKGLPLPRPIDFTRKGRDLPSLLAQYIRPS